MVFRVPKVKTCCCCVSLKNGSYVIAALNVMAFVVVLGFSTFNPSNPVYFNQAMFYYTVFLNVGVFALCLVYGLIKGDHTLIFAWILQMAVFIAFLLNYLLGSLVYLGLFDTRTEELIAELIGTVLVSYCLLVVYNHYRELKEARTEEPIES
uniref:Uncharacterized protein n=1 Tax=Lygus hesperus TaxID=30085 RepID=A0A146L2Z4_LYGHE